MVTTFILDLFKHAGFVYYTEDDVELFSKRIRRNRTTFEVMVILLGEHEFDVCLSKPWGDTDICLETWSFNDIYRAFAFVATDTMWDNVHPSHWPTYEDVTGITNPSEVSANPEGAK